MGAAPFHFWLPEVINGLNWINRIIVLTWQKIAPIILLFYNIKITAFLRTVVVISSLIGGLGGLNQTRIRKILAFSSINHIGWIISRSFNSQRIWIVYFCSYSVISINLILIFNIFSRYSLNQLFNFINKNKTIKFIFILNFLSLGGLPPFLGFLPKWLTINNLIINKYEIIRLILILSTLVTLFFYLRITFSTFSINHSETLITQNITIPNWIIIFNFITLSRLITCTIIFNFV